MRLVKFYIKSFVFKIIASNNYFKKLYLFYYNYTSNKRFRSKEYAKSAERIIDENIVAIIKNELNIKKNITLLDVGCGPDIFNNVYIFFKFQQLVCQKLTDRFKSLNDIIVSKSFKYFFNKDSNIYKKEFFKKNNYYNYDFTKHKLKNKYDIILGMYVIELFNINELNFFLNNIKDKFKICIFVCDLTDIYFIDKWNKDFDPHRFNKLKYSKFFFNLISNRFIYQNRLRFNDFIDLFTDHGYEIVNAYRCNEVHEKIDKSHFFENRKYLNFKIHKDFSKYSYEDLYTPKGIFIIKNKT